MDSLKEAFDGIASDSNAQKIMKLLLEKFALKDRVKALDNLLQRYAERTRDWRHGENCDRRWHEECCFDENRIAGWYCEEGETQAVCEGQVCDCWVDDLNAMAVEAMALLGVESPAVVRAGEVPHA